PHPRPPLSPLFPYTTLFRSVKHALYPIVACIVDSALPLACSRTRNRQETRTPQTPRSAVGGKDSHARRRPSERHGIPSPRPEGSAAGHLRADTLHQRQLSCPRLLLRPARICLRHRRCPWPRQLRCKVQPLLP